MRAIPIDRFLESGDLPTSGSGTPAWSRLVAEGRAARAAADGGFWRIGHLALLVEHRYRSGALKRFAEEIGESVGTVRRLRWVAGSYDAAARVRFSDLSFSHFQAVAGLSDRLVWLERAQRAGWSVEMITLQSRAVLAGASDRASATMRRPIDTALRALTRFEAMDERELRRAARAGLADAIEELAVHVEQVRARLARAQSRASARRTAVKLVSPQRG